jgi:hypothetical protein
MQEVAEGFQIFQWMLESLEAMPVTFQVAP